jgi:YidC/Oxa1 family membrane protein insertase
MIGGIFEGPAWLLAKFYDLTTNYIVAISMIALVVMLITAPLVLKQTKGMLEMQKLQPQMKKLQAQHRGDRQKLNEEMMKLYQEHKVNPLASCFPLLLQFPVFIIMFRVLHGLTSTTAGVPGFSPKYISSSSKLYLSLKGKSTMLSWGLDLAQRPYQVIAHSFGKGLVYALLVIALGFLYFAQQKMVAARATVSPTMSQTQQKLMQYLPVVFAVFLVFYLTGLVIYYMAQAIFRIGLQYYITRKFYKGEHSLGRQAMRASDEARELAKSDKASGGGGMFSQAKRELAATKEQAKGQPGSAKTTTVSKRVTPPKNQPTTAARGSRPPSTGKAGRPAPSGKATRPAPPAARPPKKK